uniref:ATPase, P-type (Transporting), HAD superfamily, subfamily IC n=1 Tax=Cyanothece sp. (strain PCC 7425 / ATCC 29141) TaxID=395961 RepID=B8HSP8_CYAP4
MVQLLHQSINGRSRFNVPELYRSSRLQQYLERSLIEQTEIESIAANPLTGTVIIQFAAHTKLDRPKLHQLKTLMRKLVKAFMTNPEAPLPFREAGERVPQWHGLDRDDVLQALQTTKDGLETGAVEVQRQRYGPNTLSDLETRSELNILLGQFNSLPVALLGVAAGVSVLTGGLMDAVVITGVIGLNAAIGYFTESQSERIIHSLQQQVEQTPIVLRDGQPVELNADQVVVGDVLLLKPGQFVAGDARLIQTKQLTIDESALTGESIPVQKSSDTLPDQPIPLADRHNMVYRGTIVTGGQGKAVVVAVGKRTEMGRIQRLVSQTAVSETPLSQQLDQVGSQLVFLGSGVCAIVFGMGLLRGSSGMHMLKTAISLAVAAVPEGLPTIATTILALGIQDMRQRKVLVRNLRAVEGLGSLQTLCLDKTGTITENRMTVVELQTAIGQISVDQAKFTLEKQQIHLDQYHILQKLLQIGVLCSESTIEINSTGEYVIQGSSTENALIHLAIHTGLDVIGLRQQFPLVSIKQRSERRKFMSSVHEIDADHSFIALKGSPEEVLGRCDRWLVDGAVPLTPVDRQALAQVNEAMANRALRVLALAYKEVEQNEKKKTRNLIWVGLVGMIDPIRPGVTPLIAQFHQAGIDTVMITGDQRATAAAIAEDLQLSRTPQIHVLDSTDLDHPEVQDHPEFERVNVFARVSPANKLQIVQALEASGKVVAMTGDGINDAPALKAANIGVAMGKSGTDVAREVADIVLEDDRLETLIVAVSQGRTIYNNIRKSVHFLLATNLSEILVMLAAIGAGVGEPLNPLQLLWLNLVSDVFPGLALALEPAEPDVLQQPPRDPSEPIIQPSDYGRILFESSLLSVSTLAAYGYGIACYGIGPRASSIAFMSLSSAQLLHAVTGRSQHHRALAVGKDALPMNPYLIAALAGSFGLQFIAGSVPWLRLLLNVEVLDALDWSVVAGSALVPFLINDLSKTVSPLPRLSVNPVSTPILT